VDTQLVLISLSIVNKRIPPFQNLDLIDKDPKLIFGLSGYIDSLTEEK